MLNLRSLTREQILESVDQLGSEPEFVQWRDFYLNQAVESLDLEWTRAMLDLGANPDCVSGGESLLHMLFEHLRKERTAKREAAISIAQLLVDRGANPNKVGGNNYRAVDLAMLHGLHDFTELLVAAGADPNPRPFV